MSRKRAMTPTEMRAHIKHLARHNAALVVELRGCRDAMKQQQRHIHQLLRTLDQSTPKRRSPQHASA